MKNPLRFLAFALMVGSVCAQSKSTAQVPIRMLLNGTVVSEPITLQVGIITLVNLGMVLKVDEEHCFHLLLV